MRTTDRIEHIQDELREIGRDMGSISPKLQLYAKLKERKDALDRELIQLRAGRSGALTGEKVLS